MNTFAIIATGGKQYRVAPGATIRVEKLDAEPGSTVSFSDVLLLAKGKEVEIGTPHVAGAKISGEVLAQKRARKVIIFKYHSKTRYHRTKGHRQMYTEVKIADNW